VAAVSNRHAIHPALLEMGLAVENRRHGPEFRQEEVLWIPGMLFHPCKK